MSFYSVIAGILFLEGFKALVYALGRHDNLSLPAATVAIMIVTDVMITTDAFENELKDVKHDVFLKFMDLLCFGALATMLVCVYPNGLQLFGTTEERPKWMGDPQVFWAASLAYWVFVLIWREMVWTQLFKERGIGAVPLKERTQAKRKHAMYSPWTEGVSKYSVFVYASMAVFAGRYDSFAGIPRWANVLVLAYTIVYLHSQVFHKRSHADASQTIQPVAPRA